MKLFRYGNQAMSNLYIFWKIMENSIKINPKKMKNHC